MTPEFLGRILDKARSECHVLAIGLASWTEPTLHPQLPELIRTVKAHGMPCWISSNLNPEADYAAICRAEPQIFSISCSGWSQDVYGRSHRGGDIGRVKEHMRQVAEHRRPGTNLRMSWHQYRHNQSEEEEMQRYCSGLGIQFVPHAAKLFPLELVVDYFAKPNGQLNRDTLWVAANLRLSLDDAASISRRHRRFPCRSLNREIVLDCFGRVTVCCSLYNPSAYYIGDYLQLPIQEIQRLKRQHPVCSKCRAVGGHVYYTEALTPKRRAYLRAADLWCNTLGRFITIHPKLGKATATS